MPFICATVRLSIPAITGGSGAKKSLERRNLHHVGTQTTSARHFACRTLSPREIYATATVNLVLETPLADTHRQKNTAEQASHKCTDGDTVTLITSVQQIMAGVQTADTEEDRFTLLM
jgi:hypothetical protein